MILSNFLKLKTIIHHHRCFVCKNTIFVTHFFVIGSPIASAVKHNYVKTSSIGAVDDALEVFEAPFPATSCNSLELFRRYVVVKDTFVFPEEFFFLFSHNQTSISEYRLFFLVEHLVGRAKGIRKPHRHLHGDWARSAFKVL